ncbi:Nodule Cysteine-Rich (NCR) secreted peptide [Medicago truncatula]|uniref:Nodule Cysteine-Rich (NCR) secreted peptide n=2 Tax=Medicago truncatula TaxID=3880 RepID=G7LG17_MEDTR|nr:Nodule Cysteine-Rich (NCR) secreted peptide [Medicago truncatula]AFK45391.1 unknown [Medicago truncatula]
MGDIIKVVFAMIIYLYMLTIVTNAVTICDSDQDCRRYRCDPPEYPRCLGILCKCVYVSG